MSYLWPPGSPDFSRFLSLGLPKKKIYRNKHCTPEALKGDNIRLENENMEIDVRPRTADNLQRRGHMCLAEGGDLFQYFV